MSRLNDSPSSGHTKRTQWLRLALSIQCGAIIGLNSMGCNTVGNSQLLNPKLASTPVRQPAAPIESATSHQRQVTALGASMSLNDDAPVTSAATPRPVVNGVALVNHEEHVVAADMGPTVQPSAVGSSSRGPIATLASCQVAGSCEPAIGSGSCGCSGSGCNTCLAPGAPGMNVQEYIYDGGDLDPSLVVHRDWSVAGLNPTDTVAHYETYDGRLCVTPTNRVPIYAPRFAAVRKITGAVISDHAVSTERILAPVAPGRFDETNLASTVMQPVAPLGEERVSLIDAFRDRNLGIPLAQVLPPQRISDAVLPFQYLEVFGTGILQEKEIAVIGQFLQNAREWVTPESLQVIIDDQVVSEQLDVKRAQDIHVYELPPGKCSLRICKAASHMLANSGDTITFTIRFDNAGAHPIGKVVILDSLSPRLEYIEGSQQSSTSPAARFSAEPNEVGSTVLRWELEPALQPGEGGVIHFRCLVR
jgi:uncharacterized repeat protein (TIGR01451 family)